MRIIYLLVLITIILFSGCKKKTYYDHREEKVKHTVSNTSNDCFNVGKYKEHQIRENGRDRLVTEKGIYPLSSNQLLLFDQDIWLDKLNLLGYDSVYRVCEDRYRGI